MTDIPVLPSNLHAEAAVIGSCIYDRDAIFAIAPYLNVEHFYLERHRWVYDAILRCSRQRIPPDYQTVGEVLRQMGHLEDVGGLDALIEYTTVVPTALHVEYYARAVLATAKGREVIQAGSQIAAAGYEGLDEDELIANVTRMLQRATTRPHMQGLYTAEQVDDEYGQMLERGGVKAVPTGLASIDRMLGGGLHQDELILVAARPSVGKSWFALQIARNVVRDGGVVLFCSFEMSRVELWNRMIAHASGVDSQKPRQGLDALNDDELRRITEARRILREHPIVFEDNFGISMAGIHSAALGLHAERGQVDLVIVDYIQIANADEPERRRREPNKVQEVGEISRGFKRLAGELACPVLALSQMSRSIEGRQVKRPVLSDLRDSGNLEQDADVVMFLHRDELYDKDTPRKGTADVIIAKQRNGPLGDVELQFRSEIGRWYEIEGFSRVEGY
jgi:replicative DNA helicase